MDAQTKDEKTTRLFDAIKQDDLAVVKCLLDDGVPVDVRSENGDTPLISATVHNCIGIVNELLRRNANPDLKDGEGDTALIYAVAQGRHAMMQALIDHKSDIHFIGNGRDTPLRIAIYNEDEAALEILLKSGCSAADKNHEGTPALFLAAAAYPKALAVLLKTDPDLHMHGHGGASPLRAAMSGENEDCIRQMLDAGCDPSCEDKAKKSDIAYAAQFCPPAVVEAVRQGMTKFNLIAEIRRSDPPEDILPLIQKGGNYALYDCHGKTALYYALQNYIYDERNFSGMMELAVKMIENGADLNQKMRTPERETPMFLLARQFSERVADNLIAKGGRVSVKNSEGLYPWDIARQLNNTAMADHLEMRGREEFANLANAARGTERPLVKVKAISFKVK